MFLLSRYIILGIPAIPQPTKILFSRSPSLRPPGLRQDLPMLAKYAIHARSQPEASQLMLWERGHVRIFHNER